jgi:PleD family two-component response regulator
MRKKSLNCTVSIGVTDVFKRNIESMLTVADQNLYAAKTAGRNRVLAS